MGQRPKVRLGPSTGPDGQKSDLGPNIPVDQHAVGNEQNQVEDPNEQAVDQVVGANEQNADQHGGGNEQNHDQDGGPPTKRMKK